MVPKINNYMKVVQQMNTIEHMDDFRFYYRVCRQTFEVVLGEIALDLVHYNTGDNTPISPDMQLLVLLNYVGNQHSMRNCAHFFGMSKAIVHDVIHCVINALLKLRARIIKWPSPDRQKEIGRNVQETCGIPGVVGFLDGTHIRLTHAPGGEKDYYNRKSYQSIQLQAAVDNDLYIISAYSGWPGCTHDARALRNSSLYQKAEAGELFIQGHHLLADNAYPLRNWLISPFKNYGNLTPEVIHFNKTLSSARQTVERAFGLLKSRFRILRDIPLMNPEVITKLIIVTCILHNICVINSDDVEQQLDVDDNDANQCLNVFQWNCTQN